jgi:predicted dehydrogenase
MLKLALIGGWGHHYLTAAVHDAACGIDAVAVAGDGHDDAAARRLADQLPAAAWFDAPEAMLDMFKPDVVSVGAVYGHNADLVALALQLDIPVVSD